MPSLHRVIMLRVILSMSDMRNTGSTCKDEVLPCTACKLDKDAETGAYCDNGWSPVYSTALSASDECSWLDKQAESRQTQEER